MCKGVRRSLFFSENFAYVLNKWFLRVDTQNWPKLKQPNKTETCILASSFLSWRILNTQTELKSI